MSNKFDVIVLDKDAKMLKYLSTVKNILGLMWHPERNKTYNQLNLIIKKLKIK